MIILNPSICIINLENRIIFRKDFKKMVITINELFTDRSEVLDYYNTEEELEDAFKKLERALVSNHTVFITPEYKKENKETNGKNFDEHTIEGFDCVLDAIITETVLRSSKN